MGPSRHCVHIPWHQPSCLILSGGLQGQRLIPCYCLGHTAGFITGCYNDHAYTLRPVILNRPPGTCSISTTWEHLRCSHSWSPTPDLLNQNFWGVGPSGLCFHNPPSDSATWESLRATGLGWTFQVGDPFDKTSLRPGIPVLFPHSPSKYIPVTTQSER